MHHHVEVIRPLRDVGMQRRGVQGRDRRAYVLVPGEALHAPDLELIQVGGLDHHARYMASTVSCRAPTSSAEPCVPVAIQPPMRCPLPAPDVRSASWAFSPSD
jgi:hypothetical protein